MLKLSAFADEISPDLEEQIRVCRQNGVTHFELRGVAGKNVLDFDYLISRGVVSKKDLSLFKAYDDVDSAEAYLKDFLTRHYVRGGK